MPSNDNLHLLISCGSQPQLEACLALFRDAGHTTRAHRVTSLRDLGDMLRDQRWDLLISDDSHPEVSPIDALKLLQERASDTPCIVRAAQPDTADSRACLHHGARDLIGAGDNERLLLASLREIDGLRKHRELAALRVQYAEIARRAELLLAASQDAIAYVVDGMHVHANEMYADLFGYGSVDDMASAPLVDLIAADNQREFKAALRRYRDHPEEQTAIEFTGMRADGSEFPGRLVLSTASFEGEPCMQVMVRAAAVAASASAPVASPSGGLDALSTALTASSAGHLLLIAVDGFAHHCRNLGLHSATQLIADLGAHLAQMNGWPHAPLRLSDNVLAMQLPETDTESLIALAQSTVERVSGHIHVLGRQSATCNICIVVCPLTGQETSAHSLIDKAFATLARTSERAERLRGPDPARVESMRVAGADTGVAGGTQTLQMALQGGEFRLLFQPIVSLRGDSNEYYEVHVMHTATKQRVAAWLQSADIQMPGSDLDQWSIIEACKSLTAHRARHPHTRLILGVGLGSMMNPDFGTWLAVALRAAELPPDSVVIQISHRDVSAHLREATDLVERLRGLGCQISISDVHSANNPIADLTHLKPQFARIHDDLAPALKDSDMTNTSIKPLIEALHHEQMASIMPNVEGASVLSVLWQLGVNFIQGDYLQAPSADMHYDFTDLA